MRFDISETIAKALLIFLLVIAMSYIFNKLDWPGGMWKGVLVGAVAVALSEVFFKFSSKHRKKND